MSFHTGLISISVLQYVVKSFVVHSARHVGPTVFMDDRELSCGDDIALLQQRLGPFRQARKPGCSVRQRLRRAFESMV